MGLSREVFLLPLAPVRGVGWVMQLVIDEAERERAATASPARALEELTAAVATGEITPAEAEVVVPMLAQQLLGAVQFLANWWDDHREIPRERVLATAMDFIWLGLDRLGQGERWG